jgi:hypothetical protein
MPKKKEIGYLFYDTVHNVNCKHFIPEQVDAWVPDKVDFGVTLHRHQAKKNECPLK